jgi:hypothetical protein
MISLISPVHLCTTKHGIIPTAIHVNVYGERRQADGNIWPFGDQARIEITRQNGNYIATCNHSRLSRWRMTHVLKLVFGVEFTEGGEER